MTTLAVDKPRNYELGDHNDLPVITGDVIYEGAAVGLNGSGYARPLAAGDVFGGFALRQSDNSVQGVSGKTAAAFDHVEHHNAERTPRVGAQRLADLFQLGNRRIGILDRFASMRINHVSGKQIEFVLGHHVRRSLRPEWV